MTCQYQSTTDDTHHGTSLQHISNVDFLGSLQAKGGVSLAQSCHKDWARLSYIGTKAHLILSWEVYWVRAAWPQSSMYMWVSRKFVLCMKPSSSMDLVCHALFGLSFPSVIIIGDPISDRIAEYCNDFMWREPRTTSATFLGSFLPNFPRTRVQVVARDTWFHIPEKFPLRDFPKNLFLGYPICDQPTGHGKHSATPTLFPSPGEHPTDVPYLGDFCRGMYRFPAIHLWKSPYQQWQHLDRETVVPPGERRDTNQ